MASSGSPSPVAVAGFGHWQVLGLQSVADHRESVVVEHHIAGAASGPSITRLRALDIVAWRAGKELTSTTAEVQADLIDEDF